MRITTQMYYFQYNPDMLFPLQRHQSGVEVAVVTLSLAPVHLSVTAGLEMTVALSSSWYMHVLSKFLPVYCQVNLRIPQ